MLSMFTGSSSDTKEEKKEQEQQPQEETTSKTEVKEATDSKTTAEQPTNIQSAQRHADAGESQRLKEEGKIVTSSTEQVVGQQQNISQGITQQQQQVPVPIDQQQQQGLYKPGVRGREEPTLALFNRMVAKDTHCLLGRTGVKISRLALGTMNFGEIRDGQSRPGQLSEQDAFNVLDRYVELGGNCIDTADFFPWFGPNTAGTTEKIIGNWLNSKLNADPFFREKVFIITKVRMPFDVTNVNSVGLSRANLINAIQGSLRRLQTDYVDMFVLNGWDYTVDVKETVQCLDELIRSERIRYIGLCDMKGWQVQKFIDKAKHLNLNNFVCYIGQYNLLGRGVELEVIDVCLNERIGFIAYSPLKCGFLRDESYEKGLHQPVPQTRIEEVTQSTAQTNVPNIAGMAISLDSIRRNPASARVLECCHRIGQKYGMSVSQVAIQWLLQTGHVTSVCIGVESIAELEECMALIGRFDVSGKTAQPEQVTRPSKNLFALSLEDMEELDLVSSPVVMPYPYLISLAEVAGFRRLQTLSDEAQVEFDQLSVLTNETLLLDGESPLHTPYSQQFRLNLGASWHESPTLPGMPEREFMHHVQTRAYRQQQQQQSPLLLQSQQYPIYAGKFGAQRFASSLEQQQQEYLQQQQQQLHQQQYGSVGVSAGIQHPIPAKIIQ